MLSQVACSFYISEIGNIGLLNKWLFSHTLGMTILYLTIGCALAVSSGAADAGTCVPGTRWLPGTLSSGMVVIEMPATQVFVRFPVIEDMERGARRDGWQAGLADLQLLKVGVDWGVGPTMTSGWCWLKTEKMRKALFSLSSSSDNSVTKKTNSRQKCVRLYHFHHFHDYKKETRMTEQNN